MYSVHAWTIFKPQFPVKRQAYIDVIQFESPTMQDAFRAPKWLRIEHLVYSNLVFALKVTKSIWLMLRTVVKAFKVSHCTGHVSTNTKPRIYIYYEQLLTHILKGKWLILWLIQTYMYMYIIGVSLSEPHTSVTALCTCVSIRLSDYGPTTYRKF